MVAAAWRRTVAGCGWVVVMVVSGGVARGLGCNRATRGSQWLCGLCLWGPVVVGLVMRWLREGWWRGEAGGGSCGGLGGVDAGRVVADQQGVLAAAAAAEGFGAAVRAGDGEGAGLAGLGGDLAADAGEEFLD